MFTIEANLPEVTLGLRKAATSQIPFAQSLAINWTLKDAQADLRGELRQRFTLRNTWTERGVYIRGANKRTLRGEIGHKDATMTLHAEGGEKTPTRGKALAIPTRALLRTTRKGIVPKGKRPAAILKRPTTYREDTAKGRAAIIQRRGKASPLVLYTFHPSATIRPRYPFEETVQRTVRKRHQHHFGKALAKAIASRKGR